VRTTDDALTRLGAALDIAERSIPVLAGAWGDPDQPAFRREKFVAETALLLYAAAVPAASRRCHGDRIRRVATALSSHARSPELEAALMIRPAMAAELSVAHVCLSSLGIGDARFDLVVRNAVASCPPVAEKIPWKDIEADWLARLCPTFPRCSWLPRSIEHTLLATGLDVLSAPREELYAFTHALIYLCDFGRAEAEPPRPAATVLADAEGSLACCIDDDDFDLCAELLLSWPYLRQPRSPVAAFATGLLCRLEDAVGYLPCPGLSISALDELEPEQRTRALFDQAYHTAYTMGLLQSALLLPCGEAAPLPAVRPGSAKRLWASLPPRSPEPQWQVDYRSLSQPQRDSLAPMIATIGLRRALAANDLRRVTRILELCLEAGLASYPAVGQAAALLRRFASAPPRATDSQSAISA
jgi:hypothetical protein